MTFREWLGFAARPDFSTAKWIGSIVGFVLTCLMVLFLIASISTLWEFVRAALRLGPYSGDILGEGIRNIGLVLAALIGAPFVIWRSVVVAKQARIADEALFNDKISAAAESLSARREVSRLAVQGGKEVILREVEDDLVARAAAIDRLEGLTQERSDAAPRVARMFATYVRGNFPCRSLAITEPPFSRAVPRMDLQRAVDAIGRVYKVAAEVDPTHWRLDLKSCNFDGVSFLSGYFRAADFGGSRMEACIFIEGNFEGCLFRDCLLNFSDFRKANLRGAKFDRSIINRPKPISGGLVRTLNLADITGATFIGADISAIDYLGNPEVISKTFATKDTKVSSQLRQGMLSEHDRSIAHTLREVAKDKAKKTSSFDLEKISALEDTGFQNWSPYDSSDMATGWLLESFLSELEMKKWPFIG